MSEKRTLREIDEENTRLYTRYKAADTFMLACRKGLVDATSWFMQTESVLEAAPGFDPATEKHDRIPTDTYDKELTEYVDEDHYRKSRDIARDSREWCRSEYFEALQEREKLLIQAASHYILHKEGYYNLGLVDAYMNGVTIKTQHPLQIGLPE